MKQISPFQKMNVKYRDATSNKCRGQPPGKPPSQSARASLHLVPSEHTMGSGNYDPGDFVWIYCQLTQQICHACLKTFQNYLKAKGGTIPWKWLILEKMQDEPEGKRC
jgi:hypothetical protein